MNRLQTDSNISFLLWPVTSVGPEIGRMLVFLTKPIIIGH